MEGVRVFVLTLDHVGQPIAYNDAAGIQRGLSAHVFTTNADGDITYEWAVGSLNEE